MATPAETAGPRYHGHLDRQTAPNAHTGSKGEFSGVANRASRLADAIAADILRERPEAPQSQTCFACSRSYSKAAPKADDSGPSRFCSVRCRDYFDNGGPPYDPQTARDVLNIPLRDWVVIAGPPGTVGTRPYGNGHPMTVSGDGFLIPCRHCKRPFVSRGLRCCCPDHERKYRESIEIKAALAEIGEDVPTRPKCEACGANIPRWRNGRAVPKGTRFCSDNCRQRAWKHGSGSQRVRRRRRA
jgi:hypothetical protein